MYASELRCSGSASSADDSSFMILLSCRWISQRTSEYLSASSLRPAVCGDESWASRKKLTAKSWSKRNVEPADQETASCFFSRRSPSVHRLWQSDQNSQPRPLLASAA